ncbi:MAG: ABC transporter ATP-binding protein [Chloroflexi bacterium]|nr:ABC transporter ATP-binding protein [Chloroflexota bacterium]
MTDVLTVENLNVRFQTKEGIVKAVNGVNFSLQENKILALVGESGAGKTVTSLAILGLLPDNARVTEGKVILNGKNLQEMGPEEMRQLRGKEIGAVFQDPRASLNPIMPVGAQVEEVLLEHTGVSRREARDWAEQLLREMQLPDPKRVLRLYPYELSGGMCQRVMLSIALALRPKLLIADEPTSNLDTTLQAGILDHLRHLKDEYGTAILLITHDLGIVAQMADWVAVMYAGSVVESADPMSLFRRPSHPYTWGLFQSLPRLDDAQRRLRPMRGSPADLIDLPEECPFMPRCPKASNVCRLSPRPALRLIEPGHTVACFNEVRHDWDEPQLGQSPDTFQLSASPAQAPPPPHPA